MSWRGIRGWSEDDVVSVYRDAVERAQDGDALVEVGVAYGRSLACLARLVIDSGKDLKVFGVDTWAEHGYGGGDNPVFCTAAGSFRDACEREFEMHAPEERSRVTLCQLDSKLMAGAWHMAPAHFVFIDADHSYEAVRDDIRAWVPVMKPGGIIAGHDLTPTFPGVEQAVREHFGPTGYERVGDCWRVRLP